MSDKVEAFPMRYHVIVKERTGHRVLIDGLTYADAIAYCDGYLTPCMELRIHDDCGQIVESCTVQVRAHTDEEKALAAADFLRVMGEDG